MAMTMVGTQAPQKLFADFPTQASQIPGTVTPNATAAMPSYVDWDAVMAAQNAAKARSDAGWARAGAQNAARQGAAQDEEEKAKVRAAFDQLYGPQLQNAYNDQMVAAEGTTSAMGTYTPRRQGASTHPANMFSSNQSIVDRNRPGSMPGAFAAAGGGGYTKPYRLGDMELSQQLDNMWRMQTDPYIQAVGQMGGTMRGMYPSVGGSNPAAWGRMVQQRGG